jgi:ABC-2 type transport system permease protein
MLAIFLSTIKDRKISLAIYSATGVGLLWIYVLLFPSIQAQAEGFGELMKNYPEGFLKAFGIEDGLILSTLEGFLALEQFSLVWPIIVIFLLVSLAAAGIAGEVEKGTSEIILARPVSRRNVFVGRYLAGAVILSVFTVFSVFGIVPLAELNSIDYVLKSYVIMAITGFLFGIAVFSIAMLFSAISSERGRVYMATGGILIVMYVLNLVSALKDDLGNLRYLSFFHYYDPTQALVHSSISGGAILVFIVISVACAVAGAVLFSKRDIKTV